MADALKLVYRGKSNGDPVVVKNGKGLRERVKDAVSKQKLAGDKSVSVLAPALHESDEVHEG